MDQGRPEHLGKLVRALLPEHTNLDVFTDVRAVLQAEPGSVLVLVPKPEDAEWLNLNRPIFAQRKLAVVLYCDRQTTLALADRAVDFFDWVSQHHTCPDGPPDFAVRGFRQAVANQAPGIVWTGQNVEGLVRVLGAAFPGETLRWVVPPRHLGQFVAAIHAAGDAWVACRIHAKEHMHQFRGALAAVSKRTRAIALMGRPQQFLGWWPVNDTYMTLQAAQSNFLQASVRRPGRLAALTGLEKETVELAGELLHAGVNETDLFATLVSEADPGIAVAKKAHKMGLVELPDVGLRIAPAPVLRALDAAPDVHAWREAMIEGMARDLWQGKRETIDSLLEATGLALASDLHWWITDTEWDLFRREENSAKRPLDTVDSRQDSSSGMVHRQARIPTFELSAETITSLLNGKHFEALESLAAHHEQVPLEHQFHINQLRTRIYFDLCNGDAATGMLFPTIHDEGQLAGTSTPLFAELMVDLALMFHGDGDARTAFALLHKLLSAEWASLHVDVTQAGEATAKPTHTASINDFIHLFLAQSNSLPPLPPESSARALRILAEVLLAQGRYEEAEDVARKAHETALHAPGIARPETWRALALLGRARALQGRHADGKQDLQRAIDLATKDFGKTHAEVARLWLDLARVHARNQDADTAETIRKAIDVWERAQCEAKELGAALEELLRMIG